MFDWLRKRKLNYCRTTTTELEVEVNDPQAEEEKANFKSTDTSLRLQLKAQRDFYVQDKVSAARAWYNALKMQERYPSLDFSAEIQKRLDGVNEAKRNLQKHDSYIKRLSEDGKI